MVDINPWMSSCSRGCVCSVYPRDIASRNLHRIAIVYRKGNIRAHVTASSHSHASMWHYDAVMSDSGTRQCHSNVEYP